MISNRRAGRTLMAVVVSALVLWLGVFYVSRRVEEFYYVAYLKGEYLPASMAKDGKWALSTSGVREDVQRRYLERGMLQSGRLLLQVQQRGDPVLTVLQTSRDKLQGRIQFAWLMGGTYSIEVDARMQGGG